MNAPLRAPAPDTMPAPGAAPKISFVSLGCPKALVDSERILTQLRAEGYELDAKLRRRRRGDRQHLRLPRQRQGRVARRDRRGDGRERQGHRHRLHGRRARGDPRPLPGRARGHRPAAVRDGGRGGARARAAGARSVPRPRAAAGREAHAAALRLSEDLRGLQQPLQLLHHPEAARRSRRAARPPTCCARPSGW